jgi:hypothetical protein
MLNERDWRTLSESLHDQCVTHPLPRVVLLQSHHADRDSTARGRGVGDAFAKRLLRHDLRL